MAAKLTDEERERRERMRAAAKLERSPRGVSVVSSDEEARLYELNVLGVDAPIRVRHANEGEVLECGS